MKGCTNVTSLNRLNLFVCFVVHKQLCNPEIDSGTILSSCAQRCDTPLTWQELHRVEKETLCCGLAEFPRAFFQEYWVGLPLLPMMACGFFLRHACADPELSDPLTLPHPRTFDDYSRVLALARSRSFQSKLLSELLIVRAASPCFTILHHLRSLHCLARAQQGV